MPRYYRALLTATLLGAFSLPALAQTPAPAAPAAPAAQAAPAAPMASTAAPAADAAPKAAKTTKTHTHHHAAKKTKAKPAASKDTAPAADDAAPKN